MPAKKKPVANREARIASPVVCQTSIKLHKAPRRALHRKTFEGEKRSVKVNSAKSKVPMINPNWTEAVILPKLSLIWSSEIRLVRTPFPANQSEVQKNCAITMVGRICLGGFTMLFTNNCRKYSYRFTKIKDLLVSMLCQIGNYYFQNIEKLK